MYTKFLSENLKERDHLKGKLKKKKINRVQGSGLDSKRF
jgi:hypothetical protein